MYNVGMKRINLFLTDQQIATLKDLSQKTGLSYAELIRRAIDNYLRRHKKND